MKWFRRKRDKKPHLDMSEYKMHLTMRAMCLFEHLTGKSFYESNEDDALIIMYCCFVSSNDVGVTYKAFEYFIEDKDVQNWLTREYLKEVRYLQQDFNPTGDVTTPEEEKKDNKDGATKATDVAAVLIIQGGLDPHYVYDEMRVWEIPHYYTVMENMKKEEYERERFFTYLSISPHIDTKKCKSPEDLTKFPWEKTSKEKATDDLQSKQDMILATLMAMNKKKEESTDGEPDTISRPGDTPAAVDETQAVGGSGEDGNSSQGLE